MTKQELIDAVAKKAGEGTTKRAVTELVDNVFDIVAGAVKKNKKFTFPGFGTFTLKKTSARKGINPATKQPMQIKAGKTIRFKPSKTLKETL
jgi:DNA-binding protein HU-beta